MNRRAFTLVELLIYLAIAFFAIAAGVLFWQESDPNHHNHTQSPSVTLTNAIEK